MRDRPDESLSSVELWKAQLAYVSGTVLAWGAVLLQLWPVLARLQTGAHVQALGRDTSLGVPPTSFYLLALLVAVGLGMLAFGSMHMVARGFWFARPLTQPPASTTGSPSDRVAHSTYIVLHVFWATALVFLCIVPLFALSAVVGSTLTTVFGWPVAASRTTAALLVFAAPLAGLILFYRRRWEGGRARLIDAARRVGLRNLAMACVSLPLLWLLVIEFSYVAEVRLERPVFSRAANATIVVAVELGGAVSDPAPARVVLSSATSTAGASEPLRLRPVGRGSYVSTVPTQSLPNGDYEIELTYPHGSLSPVFPFFRNRIERRVGFVMVD